MASRARKARRRDQPVLKAGAHQVHTFNTHHFDRTDPSAGRSCVLGVRYDVGLGGSRKSTPYDTASWLNRGRPGGYGARPQEVDVFVKGPGLVEFNHLLQSAGLGVGSITDVTPRHTTVFVRYGRVWSTRRIIN